MGRPPLLPARRADPPELPIAAERGRLHFFGLARLGADVVAERHVPSTIVLRSVPSPSTSTSTTSPGCGPGVRRRAGEQHVAGQQRDGSGDVGDQVVHVPDHLVGVAVLPHLAVHAGLDALCRGSPSPSPGRGRADRACRSPSRGASSRRRCRGSRAARSRWPRCSRGCDRPRPPVRCAWFPGRSRSRSRPRSSGTGIAADARRRRRARSGTWSACGSTSAPGRAWRRTPPGGSRSSGGRRRSSRARRVRGAARRPLRSAVRPPRPARRRHV